MSAQVAEVLGAELSISAMHTLDLKGFGKPHTVAEIDWRQ